MPQRQACLMCAHCRCIPPPDWRPRYSGEEFDNYDIAKLIKATGKSQKITCTLNPVWIEFNFDHYCGQFSRHPRVYENTLNELIHGSYVSLQNIQYEKQLTDLRQQLKRSREISASRLARLKARAGKG
jgi:hypothetical protein